MGRFVGYAPCPKCRARGADRRGDNLAIYSDGSAHCFANCGYHKHPRLYVRKEVNHADENKAVLPRDFTREVPAAGWKWLLQYGLPYSYWKPFTGYSPAEERLILLVGDPTVFSIGRYVGGNAEQRARESPGFRKWRIYGDRAGFAQVLGTENTGPTEAVAPIVLVEDIISWHKVAQVAPSLCLFGTDIHSKAIQVLKPFKRPVSLWLDEDQYGVLPKKITRLQTFLDVPVAFIRKRKDPKEYSTQEIKEIVYAG
jgi:hypothetical protein